MFELEPGLLIWSWVSFLALVALLYKYLLPPLIEILEKREQQIQAGLDSAALAHSKAENLLLEYKKKIEEAHKMANQVIDSSKIESDVIIKEATDRAKQEAKIILDQVKLEIEADKRKMLKEIKDIGADLIIEASKKVIGR